jgi:hypothetical protein
MKYYLFIFLFFSTIGIYSQNLVPNYSFEDTLHCPTAPSQMNLAIPWFQPTTGTPDYFNECSTGAGIPVPGGYQYPRTGQAFAGVIFFAFSSFREYIETALTSPLIAGKQYNVSFYVNLSERSNYAIDAIGLYFSTDSVTSSNNQNLSYQPQIKNTDGNILNDTANWLLISGEYTATGGEKYITIGNFKNNANTDSLFLGGGGGAVSYYYIDDISVVLSDSTIGIKEQNQPTTQLSTYPNPANPIFTIQLPTQQTFTLSVTDITGRTVYTSKNATGNITIDCSDFSSGVYFVKAVNERTVLTGKVVKE